MKKIILLLSAILFGVSASFAQGPTVKVSWNDDNCSCTGVPDHFKVTMSIYDDANSTWVIQNRTFNTSDATAIDIVFDVPEVTTYCHDTHDYTPDFTVSATVWLILVGGEECCTGSKNVTADCKSFANNGQVKILGIILN